jgi:hypothetical protein
MELTEFYGHKLNLNEFASIIDPEELRLLVLKMIGGCRRIPGIDVQKVASIVMDTLAKGKDTFDPDHESGKRFYAYIYQRIYWALGEAMRSREAFSEGSIYVPLESKHKVSLVRLDDDSDEGTSCLEKIPSVNSSPDTILEAKGLLWEAADPIAVMLGILRVIPFRQPQRTIDVFESYYGLNGRRKESLSKVGRTWSVSVGAIDKIIQILSDQRYSVASKQKRSGEKLITTRIITNSASIQSLRHMLKRVERRWC